MSTARPWYWPLLWVVFIAFNLKEKVLVVISLAVVPHSIIANHLYSYTGNSHVRLYENQVYEEKKGFCAIEFYTEGKDYVIDEHSARVCQHRCNKESDCAGYEIIGNFCLRWITPCEGPESQGWHNDNSAQTLVASNAVALSHYVKGLEFLWTRLSLSDLWDPMYLTLTIMAVSLSAHSFLALWVVLYMLWVGIWKYRFGTYQYMWEIVAVKKSRLSFLFFKYTMFLCIAFAVMLLCLLFKGCIQWDFKLLIIPVTVLANAMDFRKVNFNLYPYQIQGKDIFLKIGLNLSFCAAEEVLVLIENGALAYKFSEHIKGHKDLLKKYTTEEEDIRNILEAMKGLGTELGAKSVQGDPTDNISDRNRVIQKSLSIMMQLKPYALVSFGAVSLMSAAREDIFPQHRPGILQGFVKAWVYLLQSFIVIFFYFCAKNLVVNNPHPYGTLQYFLGIVQVRRTRPFFVRFYVFISVYMPFFWAVLGISHVLIIAATSDSWTFSNVRSPLDRYFVVTGKDVLLIIVNAVQTRRVASCLYPLEMPESPIFLKLKPLKLSISHVSDALSTAEEILERLETGYMVNKFTARDEFLRGILPTSADEDVAKMFTQFGDAGRWDLYKDEAEKVKFALIGACCTSLAAFLWEVLSVGSWIGNIPENNPVHPSAQFNIPVQSEEGPPDLTGNTWFGGILYFLFTLAFVGCLSAICCCASVVIESCCLDLFSGLSQRFSSSARSPRQPLEVPLLN